MAHSRDSEIAFVGVRARSVDLIHPPIVHPVGGSRLGFAAAASRAGVAEAVKLLARAHQTLNWDRQRAVLRLRSVLQEFFPAAVEAFCGAERRRRG